MDEIVSSRAADRPPPEPWELLKKPAIGDADMDETCLAVGRALTNWEWIEGHMAVLFAQLVGARAGSFGSVRAYGTVTGSQTRLGMIREAAEVFFAEYPSEQTHIRLNRLLAKVGKLAGKRNDIAHGIVQPYSSDTGNSLGYALFPAWYATRKRKYLGRGEQTEAAYVYTSREIEIIYRAFYGLYDPTMELINGVISLSQYNAEIVFATPHPKDEDES